MAQFRFVMRSGPTVGKVYPLEAAEISIGRDSSNMVAINDAEVSRGMPGWNCVLPLT